jgi:hypothetical protein
MIFATPGGKPFGFGGCVAEADTRTILEQVVVSVSAFRKFGLFSSISSFRES